jgi:nicotinate-nucleotide pyrophosphorylase
MRIIGHQWIESPQFITIYAKEDIANTQANSILLFNDLSSMIDEIRYCFKEGLAFGLRVDNLNDALLAYNLNAKYLIVIPKLAKELQKIAQQYLFDTQILVEINSAKKIEKYAQMGIDGVIFGRSIV